MQLRYFSLALSQENAYEEFTSTLGEFSLQLKHGTHAEYNEQLSAIQMQQIWVQSRTSPRNFPTPLSLHFYGAVCKVLDSSDPKVTSRTQSTEEQLQMKCTSNASHGYSKQTNGSAKHNRLGRIIYNCEWWGCTKQVSVLPASISNGPANKSPKSLKILIFQSF